MTIDELVVHLIAIAPDQPLTDATWMWQGGGHWVQVPDVLDDWRDEFRRARYMLGRDPVDVAMEGGPLPAPLETAACALPPPVPLTPSEPVDGYWRARRTAAFLGMSESWVYHRAAEGRLPCVRIGGALRFEPAAIKAFTRGEGTGRGRVVALAKSVGGSRAGR
jgi:predicted DNA-binding transcriptional regulator AlpA